MRALVLAIVLVSAPALAGSNFALDISAGTPSPDDLLVTVDYTTVYLLSGKLHAQVLGSGADLSPVPGVANRVDGHVSLAGIPLGTQTVTVTIQDVQGNTGTGTATFLHFHPPKLIVGTTQTVARPEIAISADCVDEQGDCNISVYRLGFSDSFTSPPVAMGRNHLAACVSMAAYAGQEGRLVYTASDPTGAGSDTLEVPLSVEPSQSIAETDSVPGKIFDFDSNRILYGPASLHQAFLRERSSGAGTKIFDDPAMKMGYLVLELSGNLLYFGPHQLYDSGALLLLDQVPGQPPSPSTLGYPSSFGLFQWNGASLSQIDF